MQAANERSALGRWFGPLFSSSTIGSDDGFDESVVSVGTQGWSGRLLPVRASFLLSLQSSM
jgi:hypothetical protein